MAVHLPLTMEAQAEARLLMMSTNNILAPKDGKPITTPSQDMVLGAYYMTTKKENQLGDGRVFKDFDEMMRFYSLKEISLHANVGVRIKLDENDRGKIVYSTVGRFIFNQEIPQDIGFVDRSVDPYSLEIDQRVDKKMLGKIIDKTFRRHGNIETVKLLDYIKKIGYRYSTIGALTISMNDIKIPASKPQILKEAHARIDEQQNLFQDGLVSEKGRYTAVITIWTETTDRLTKVLAQEQVDDNNLSIMQKSGARGSEAQIRQLAGMRGLMSDASGRTVEIPIKANFREGLSVQEFFISTHGSRKGLSDTALRTADSGYLTRRLVDVSQDVIVRREDCGTDEYVVAKTLKIDNDVIETIEERIIGRFAFEDILDLDTGEIIVKKDEMIDEGKAARIAKQGIEEVKIRSVMGCKEKNGVCAKCYGRNLATGKMVNVGESVGIIAAQSIGEPGTQLTMRTFHSGGIAGVGITQGLPRVEELFEARKPKGLAYITEIAGVVDLQDNKKRTDVIINGDDGEQRIYTVPYGSRIKVAKGEYVEKGQAITEGSINPHDILEVTGAEGVQEYITKEVQKVYRLQGVDIDDKHIEIIIRQMLSKVKIEDAGDTDYIEGSLVNIRELEKVNQQMREEGKQEAQYSRTLLGITKASLATDSFLSAASFQETTRVLTDAAIKGRQDDLIGLKENVIIGKLIPAGTGMKRYDQIQIHYATMDKEVLSPQKRLLDLKKEHRGEESADSEASTEEILEEDMLKYDRDFIRENNSLSEGFFDVNDEDLEEDDLLQDEADEADEEEFREFDHLFGDEDA